MTTILSPNRYKGRYAKIRVIVIHTMETEENGSIAEIIGRYFAKSTTKASAHVGVDTDSECRYVVDSDTAWAAPGCNADGLQLELTGRAGQTNGQWADEASEAILERGAQRVAKWCALWGIPAKRLTDEQLRAGHSGIVGHDNVSRVYRKSSHWDPGPNFPWAAFIDRVNELLGGAAPVTPTVATPSTSNGDSVMTKLPLRNWTKVSTTVSAHDRRIQHLLAAAGYPLAYDGIAGPKSRAALAAFQVKHKTGDSRGGADYLVGEGTWAALLGV